MLYSKQQRYNYSRIKELFLYRLFNLGENNRMDFEQAKEFINSKALSELTKDKSGKGYICPICNSGSGAKGTGITTTDNIHFTCWAGGCFKNASWIDILAIKAGISPDNTKEAIENALNIYGIKLDSNLSFKGSTPAKQTEINQNKTDLSKQFATACSPAKGWRALRGGLRPPPL